MKRESKGVEQDQLSSTTERQLAHPEKRTSGDDCLLRLKYLDRQIVLGLDETAEHRAILSLANLEV